MLAFSFDNISHLPAQSTDLEAEMFDVQSEAVQLFPDI
jgi:hypothetical protein